MRACADALRGWERIVTDRLLRSGLRPGDAAEVATVIISAPEGAEVTAQVNRSEEPLPLGTRQGDPPRRQRESQ